MNKVAMSKEAAGTGGELAAPGRDLAQAQGCRGCHSVDGSPSLGPTWKGLYGKTETLADGALVVVDADYLKQSIVKPQAMIVKGYSPVMPPYNLTGEQLDALVAYMRDLSK
jgi:cytochrome c oxidase subunit 2